MRDSFGGSDFDYFHLWTVLMSHKTVQPDLTRRLFWAKFKCKAWIRNLHVWSSKLHVWRRTSCKHLLLWSLRFRLSWLKLGLSLHTNKVRCVYFLRVCLWRRRRPFRADEPFSLSPKVFQTLESCHRDETGLGRGSEPLQDKESCDLKPLKTV